MLTTKYIAACLTLLLAGLFGVSTQAQSRPVPAGEGGAVLSIKGVEISSGTQEFGETYGWTCFGTATGDMAGDFTLWMDIDSVRTPGGTAYVESGDWTLPIYEATIQGATYIGALYGDVQFGEVTWDNTGTTASMELKLLITGGTETMSNTNGTAFLYATVTYDEKGAGAFAGTLVFEFQ